MKENFIKMMRTLVYPVCIVSAKSNNNKYAITVSSVTSVSLDPPSLLVCINRSSSITDALHIGGRLNLNFLAPAQKEIASICSSKENKNKRFDNDLWAIDVNNTPFLEGSNAIAFSKIADIVEHETHIIVIVYVDRIIANDLGQRDPLLYCNGSYMSKGLSGLEST
tara:strand:- start:4883 stop:5380 length:498 start_codon:yes stop_codon:yes gene_type:complete